MKRSIIAGALAATFLFAPAAWSQATAPDRQTIRYFKTTLEKDPTRDVELVSITVPPGAGNEFHRHAGDQWTAVQEGEVTFTIKGQPRWCSRPARATTLRAASSTGNRTSATSRHATSC
jgi:hypothetical protein